MKGILISLFVLNTLTIMGQIPDDNNPDKFPNQVNKWFVKSLNDRPIAFYLNHPDIDKYSKLYYQGKFAVSDDKLTFAFLDSVLTNNKETKDFYLFVFNAVLRIADGALSEYIGQDCRKYLELFPCDFIKLRNNKLYADNYQKWIDFAGFEYYFESNPIETVNKEIDQIRKKLPKDCSKQGSELENIRLKIIEYIKENQ